MSRAIAFCTRQGAEAAWSGGWLEFAGHDSSGASPHKRPTPGERASPSTFPAPPPPSTPSTQLPMHHAGAELYALVSKSGASRIDFITPHAAADRTIGWMPKQLLHVVFASVYRACPHLQVVL